MTSKGDENHKRTMEDLEKEIDLLNQQVSDLEHGMVQDPPEELSQLMAENEKLKYRIKHLKRSVAIETNLSISEKLTALITTAFRISFPELLNFEAKVISSDKVVLVFLCKPPKKTFCTHQAQSLQSFLIFFEHMFCSFIQQFLACTKLSF